MDLFEAARKNDPTGVPLAERMRPSSLEEIVGQPHLTGPSGFLSKCLSRHRVPSMILWGPPGTGKTTVAQLLASQINADCIHLSAVMAGIKEIRAAIAEAKKRRAERGVQTILFIDEIHRFNKSQQDALLPHVENGVLTLIGATTENPSFEVNAALLSRCRVLVTRAIDESALDLLVGRALGILNQDLQGDGSPFSLRMSPDARLALLHSCGGDARKLLLALDIAFDLCIAEIHANSQGETDGPPDAAEHDISKAHVEQAIARKVVLFDKTGDAHYNVVSAFIKSMRASDPQAACHYLARMLEAGEDPRFIIRRMVIFASEDIGNADPMALHIATSALQAFELVGLPEGTLSLTQAATYLSCAPKSNAVYEAYKAAQADVREHPSLPIPKHLLNAPTTLMKNLGYGKGYQYPHQYDGHFVKGNHLPEELRGRTYYQPSDNGYEKKLKARLEAWQKTDTKG